MQKQRGRGTRLWDRRLPFRPCRYDPSDSWDIMLLIPTNFTQLVDKVDNCR